MDTDLRKAKVNGLPKWLTSELIQEVRNLYEPRYKKTLSDFEVYGIAENLSQLMEHYLKFKWRLTYGDNIK